MGWAELNHRMAARRLLTYADVDACGIPRSTFDDRTRREGWPDRPYPGVMPVPGTVLDPVDRIHAAVLSVRGQVWVGGMAALHLHGLLETPPTQTLLWVPAAQRGRTSRTRRVRRSSLLGDTACWTVAGIPVVSPAWALHDVAGETTLDRLRSLAIDARFAGLVDDHELAEVIARDRRFAGRARYARVADDLRSDGSDSGFEFRTRDRLAAVGLAPDEGQERLATPGRPRDIDLPYARYRVGIECLGLRYHGRADLDRDAERTNDIAVLDEWLILHLTYRMQFGPAWTRFLARLRGALEARGFRSPA